MKRESRSIVGKTKTDKQGFNAVSDAWLAQEGWKKTYGHQDGERQKRLQTRKPAIRGPTGQHQVSGAIVILAVHPGDCHEVRKLPEEDNTEEHPCLEGQLSRRCGPADQRRHCGWKRSSQGAHWRPSF